MTPEQIIAEYKRLQETATRIADKQKFNGVIPSYFEIARDKGLTVHEFIISLEQTKKMLDQSISSLELSALMVTNDEEAKV